MSKRARWYARRAYLQQKERNLEAGRQQADSHLDVTAIR